MTSKLQRLIDLEIEQFIQEEPLDFNMESERKLLRHEVEKKLGAEFTIHSKDYEAN